MPQQNKKAPQENTLPQSNIWAAMTPPTTGPLEDLWMTRLRDMNAQTYAQQQAAHAAQTREANRFVPTPGQLYVVIWQEPADGSTQATAAACPIVGWKTVEGTQYQWGDVRYVWADGATLYMGPTSHVLGVLGVGEVLDQAVWGARAQEAYERAQAVRVAQRLREAETPEWQEWAVQQPAAQSQIAAAQASMTNAFASASRTTGGLVGSGLMGASQLTSGGK